MRVFEYTYRDSSEFKAEIEKLRAWCNTHSASNVLFHVYTQDSKDPNIGTVLHIISTVIPRALYVGASTSGNILDGELSDADICVTATVFEDPETTVQIHQYSLTDDTVERVCDQVVQMVNSNNDITAVEFLLTIQGMSMTGLCEKLSGIREDVKIFGGAALNKFMDDNDVVVFSKVGDISDKSIVFVLYGGKNLFADAFFIGGWNPLGHQLKITRCTRNRLYELDGKPAYDTFSNYLSIKNDENFFVNSLEFPLLMNINGVDILRAPTACNPDGSLNMTADMTEGAMAHLSYGDPWTILRTVNQFGLRVQDFDPQAIYIFSCAARKTFWDSSSKETKPFTSLASTTGFYTAGEFVRTGQHINQHNVTLVVVSMREGPAKRDPDKLFHMEHSQDLSGQVSMVNRLANFIDKATQELEEANFRLSVMAVTDGLTKIFNRLEIQRRISSEVILGVTSGEDSNLPSLIMIDIDNFKSVNDCCGHSEGDNVIKGLANMIKDVIDKRAPGSPGRRWSDGDLVSGRMEGVPCAGRWGGEEFMILLPKTSLSEAADIAEAMRLEFNNIAFTQAGHQTISVGVTRAVRGENVDMLCGRVDQALYEAKKTGKNKVVVK